MKLLSFQTVEKLSDTGHVFRMVPVLLFLLLLLLLLLLILLLLLLLLLMCSVVAVCRFPLCSARFCKDHLFCALPLVGKTKQNCQLAKDRWSSFPLSAIQRKETQNPHRIAINPTSSKSWRLVINNQAKNGCGALCYHRRTAAKPLEKFF